MTAGYDGRTALLIVDMQNDFADPSGSLYVAGGDEVVDAVNQEIGWAVDAGATVVYTQDWHPPDTPHFEKDGGVWPVHCVRDTWGAAFHPGLTVLPDAPVVRKGVDGEDGYSAFSVRSPTTGEQGPTGLDQLLAGRGVERVVIVGLATDYCVKETGLDAIRRGLPTAVITDAVRAVDLRRGDGTRALEELEQAGATLA